MICFKNGYSYVNIPVALTSDQPICEGTNIRECEVGPLPNFAVHGTVSLAPHTPESVKIFSISQAPTKILPVTKKTCKTLPLKIPQNDEENDFSYENVLIENIGNAISLTCLVQTGAKETARERTFTGIIKSVYKDFRGNGQGLVVLKALEPNAGEKMIKCSSILFLETIPLPDEGSDDEEDVVESGRQRRNDGMESFKSISVRYAVDKTHSEDKVVANLSYLTQGLLWAPSYMLRQDKKSKTMTLQGNACLLCDLPFFKGNSIDSVALVAGQPKMECQNICDPLASGITAAQFKSQLDRLDPIQIPIRSDRTGRRDDYRRRELSSMMHMARWALSISQGHMTMI
jgi:hypothetical protein